MKRIFLFTSFLFLIASCGTRKNQAGIRFPDLPDNSLNFIVASDLGRNGYYEQKTVARIMGSYAENTDISFIVAAGDVHHFKGVASSADPLWMTNYELVYDHPDLMIDWFAISGNHEYRGNTQAVLDYASVSRRWNAEAKYYTKVFEAGDSARCRIVFIDTTPMMDKYRTDSLLYPDACRQNFEKQLIWIDSVLTASTEKWKIVIGHHPVYAQTTKEESERTDMQSRLAPVLEKNGVDIYFCGHIHNFQHIRPQDSSVEYVVNSSGSLSRKVKATEGAKFCSDHAGFTLCTAADDAFEFMFIDGNGDNLYSYRIVK